jgi:ribosomal protein S21
MRRERRNDAPRDFKPLEVTSAECNGDISKMIKRFTKKTRKEEVLKPYYERILYWETKSQKERKKKQKGIYEWRRSQKNLDVEDVKE